MGQSFGPTPDFAVLHRSSGSYGFGDCRAMRSRHRKPKYAMPIQKMYVAQMVTAQLVSCGPPPPAAIPGIRRGRRIILITSITRSFSVRLANQGRDENAPPNNTAKIPRLRRWSMFEIGRASCRER